MAFSEVAGRFVAEKQRDPAYKLTEQTRGQYEAAYRLFDSWAKKPTLDAVDRRKASDFLDAVAKLDPRWGRGAGVKKMSFDDIEKRFSGGGKGLANKTINRYAMALGMVWQYAEDRDGFEGKNPWTGQMRPTTKRRGSSQTDKRGFTPTEVQKVLARPPSTQIALTTEDTLPWLSLISAFSGMRLNELAYEAELAAIGPELEGQYLAAENGDAEAQPRIDWLERREAELRRLVKQKAVAERDLRAKADQARNKEAYATL